MRVKAWSCTHLSLTKSAVFFFLTQLIHAVLEDDTTERLPDITTEEIPELIQVSFSEIVATIVSPDLTEATMATIHENVAEANAFLHEQLGEQAGMSFGDASNIITTVFVTWKCCIVQRWRV